MKKRIPSLLDKVTKVKPIFFLSLVLLLTACSQVTDDSQTLKMNLGFEPPTLDWNLANDMTSFDVISNIMVGLTRYGFNDDGEIIAVPGCAQSWQISEDARDYIFHLNPKAKWTDGKKVRAQDFVDSFRRTLNPENAAPYASLLSMIDLDKTYAKDDATLIIKLKNPAPYFIYLTSYGLALPIRKDLIDKYGKDWTEPKNLVTNGPFKLKQWQHEYKILLERNEDFHLEKAQIQFLKYFMVPEQSSAFTLFKNRQFDWIDNRSIPISEHRRMDKSQALKTSLLRNTYIGFNNKAEPFNNKKLRQAFAYALDRNAITKIRSKGDQPNNTWIPPSLGQYLDFDKLLSGFKKLHGFKPSKAEYTRGYFPELARTLLKESGYQFKTKPELRIPNTEDSKLLAETLQSMWLKELGIEVEIVAMEWKVYLSSLNNDPPELHRLNWGADYPDPDTFIQLFTSGNFNNHGLWSNKRYDQLTAQAGAILDKEKRKELYTEAEIILSQEELGITPIYIDTQTILQQPEINNLVVNPMDIIFLDKVTKTASLRGL